MTAQAALIAETIAGMKRAVATYENSSDEDEPYLQSTNWGNKLKRKAHYIDDGYQEQSIRPKTFRRSIEHAGYPRDILRRNPKRYDEDGDELDDEDVDEEADVRAAEENPYAEIKLESLLSPLTSAANLPEHPSLSVPYLSTMLTNMTQHACNMVHRERTTLSSAKRLLTKFRGDETWIPCGAMCSESDDAIFDTEKLLRNTVTSQMISKISGLGVQKMMNGTVNGNSNGNRNVNDGLSLHMRSGPNTEAEPNHVNTASHPVREHHISKSTLEVDNEVDKAEAGYCILSPPLPTATYFQDRHKINDVGRAEARDQGSAEGKVNPDNSDETNRRLEDEIVNIVGPDVSYVGEEATIESTQLPSVEVARATNGSLEDKAAPEPNISNNRIEPVPSIVKALKNHNSSPMPDGTLEEPEEEADGDAGLRPPRRRMRTRAQAQAASEPATSARMTSPDPYTPLSIHPIFKMPDPAMPDRDFGLPRTEAKETRHLLTIYVQKQEEICRGAERLYDGLLLADRQRKSVFKWCKAEGHVGEMSDGEDWYDKEEWGLEEDLRKGHYDDEEDTVIQGKKTRGRRA